MKIQLRPGIIAAFISLTLLLLPFFKSGADQVRYIYDDAGRLYRVIDENGNVAVYHYDAVGNILGVERGTAGSGFQISGISPDVGAADSMFEVVITGSALSGSSITTGNPGIGITNVHTTDSAITAQFNISPSATLGATSITISNILGSAQTPFTVKPSPTHIDSVTPSSAPVSRLVEITGKGFNSNPSENIVLFNGVAAAVYHSSRSTILTSVPPGAVTGPITVSSGDGLFSNGVSFTVENAGPPPKVSAILPNAGVAEGGKIVTVMGSDFTSDTRAFIGGDSRSFDIISPSVLRVTTAPHKAGSYDVLVTNANGDAFIPGGYTYVEGPDQRILYTSPAFGSTGVPTNSSISAIFIRPVDPATVNAGSFAVTETATGTPVSGTFSFDYSKTVVSFRPQANLKPNNAYTLKINFDIRSIEGIPPNAQVSGSFTTRSSVDATPPGVIVSPADGETGVPVNTVIALGFSEPMSTVTINDSTLTVTNNGNPVQGSITFSQGNTVAVFTSSSDYLPNSTVRVTLSGRVTDLAGNPIVGGAGVGTDLVSSFTTSGMSDMVPPRILSIDPPDKGTDVNTGSAVSVTFSEPVSTATVNTHTFVVTALNVPCPGTVTFSADSRAATFIPETPLPAGCNVSVVIGQITDMAGNAMPVTFQSGFTTRSNADATPPHVVVSNPYGGQTNVPTNSPIQVAFDEPVYAPSINSSNIYVTDSTWHVVPGDLSLSVDGRVAVFQPAPPLSPNTSYRLCYGNIRDSSGNQLANPACLNFTTGIGPDSLQPHPGKGDNTA